MLLPQPRMCGPACEPSARGSDLQGARRAGRAASSTLLTAWDMGLPHAGQVAWVPVLRPAAPGCAQLPLPVQGLKLPGSTRDADGEGDSGSPKARAPAQHSECGGALAAGQWLAGLPALPGVPPSNRKGSSPPCRAPPCPATAPRTLWGRNRELGTVTVILAHVSMKALKGAGLGAVRDIQRSPTAWHREASPTWHGQERESDRTL